MYERQIKLGYLAQLQQDLAVLQDKAEGIIGSINASTFVVPLGSPFDLDANKPLNYAKELAQTIREGNEIRVAITKLKSELGIE